MKKYRRLKLERVDLAAVVVERERVKGENISFLKRRRAGREKTMSPRAEPAR